MLLLKVSSRRAGFTFSSLNMWDESMALFMESILLYVSIGGRRWIQSPMTMNTGIHHYTLMYASVIMYCR